MKHTRSTLTFLSYILSLSAISPLYGDVLVSPNQRVAFLGDSITQQGAGSESGYVQLVESGLRVNDIPIQVIPAGVGGHKSNQMLARLEKDVLNRKPDWLLLSCGVNDVWHKEKGVPLEDYKKNIIAIVDQATAAGVKVMILTATPIQESKNPLNTQLAEYNQFLKELAAERKIPVADLNARMWKEIEAPTFPRPGGNVFLTYDGVHMGPFGNIVMAEGILETFGLDAAQLQKARSAWMARSANVHINGKISVEAYHKLATYAAEQNIPLDEAASRILTETVEQKFASEAATRQQP